jgi:hypothetical protein
MNKVFFTKDINSTIARELGDYCRDAVIIYHAMYPKPTIEAQRVLEWQEFQKVYRDFDATKMVLIGLNRMINPANRCDFIHDFLTTLTPNIPKIVIDTAPFIGEPWRLFYPYLFSNTNKFGYNYSYPIEGEWKKWFFYETNDCRLSADNLKLFIPDTYTDLERLMATYSFYEPALGQIEWYSEIKAHIFSKYNTPKLWINGLLGECNKHFKLKFDFDSYLNSKNHEVPDLGVYRFIVEENKRRQAIYNVFTV